MKRKYIITLFLCLVLLISHIYSKTMIYGKSDNRIIIALSRKGALCLSCKDRKTFTIPFNSNNIDIFDFRFFFQHFF